MEPYKIVSEDDEGTTYEYNSVYSWALIGIIAVVAIGMAIENMEVQLVGAVSIFLYFGLKLTLGKDVTKLVNTAVKSGSVQVSGSKYSMNNPLKIRITKSA